MTPRTPQDDEGKIVFETIHPLDSIRIPLAARQLIDALDREKRRDPHSLNVESTLSVLRSLVEHHERGGRV